MIRILTAFALLAALSACQSDEEYFAARDAENRRIPLQAWEGTSSVADQFFVRLADNSDDWEFFWSYTKDRPPRPLLEGEEIAAFVFLGQRPTGGYEVVIESLYVEEDRAAIEWTEIEPGEGDMVTDALTYPWAIAVFRHDGTALRLVDLGPAVEPGGEVEEGES